MIVEDLARGELGSTCYSHRGVGGNRRLQQGRDDSTGTQHLIGLVLHNNSSIRASEREWRQDSGKRN